MVKKIIKIINKEIGGLHEAAYLLGFFALLSQILALFRDKLLAYTFGASEILDVYYASFRIPDLIFVVFSSTLSASIMIPFLTSEFSKSEEDGRKFINNIFSVFFLVMIIVSAILFFLIPFLAPKLLPGFASKNLLNDLIVATRILLLSPILLGLSNLFGSLAQMHKRFFSFAISPLLYNIGIIVGVLWLYPIFGVKGLFLGVVLGASLHFFVQVPFVFKLDLLPKFSFFIDWNSIKKVLFLSIPRSITLSSNQIASFFLISFGSLMSAGSISVFNLSLNLQSIPLSIIGVSYSSAIFPTLSKFYIQKSKDQFLEKMIESAKHIIFWSLPATILFIVLRAQIVRVIYGAGNFNWSDTKLTAASLAIFVVSVVGQSLILLFVRSYYAEGKTSKPLILNIISACFMIVIAFLFIKIFNNFYFFRHFIEDLFKVSGESGTEVLMLPFAFSIGSLFNAYLHWRMFEKDYNGFTKSVAKTFLEVLSASIIMGYATFLLLRFWGMVFPLSRVWGIFMQGLFSGLVGIFVFIFVLILLKNKEIIEMWQAFHQKIWKSKIIIPDQESL